MPSFLQWVAIGVSATLLMVVLELVRRRRLTEEYSFIWVVCAGALLGLSIFRGALHAVARWLGIFYPPVVLLLCLIVFVFAASLYFSVVISRQRYQIERLVEDLAILEADVRRGAASRDSAGTPRDPVPSPSAEASGS
jgi:hypothetical protein